MNTLIIVLRIIHIVAGIYWVGAALLMNFVVGPSIGATGDAGRQFAGHMMTKTKFSMSMTVSVILVLVAGTWLYWIDSNEFTSAWMRSGAGIVFGVGAVFASIGAVAGFMNGGNNRKLGALGAQIQGKPNPEQLAQIQAIQKQQAMIIPLNTYTLLLAVLCMATARYFIF